MTGATNSDAFLEGFASEPYYCVHQGSALKWALDGNCPKVPPGRVQCAANCPSSFLFTACCSDQRWDDRSGEAEKLFQGFSSHDAQISKYVAPCRLGIAVQLIMAASKPLKV